MSTNSRYRLGVIVGTHGIRGEVKLSCPYKEIDLSTLDAVIIDNRVYALEGVRWHKQNALLTLKGIPDLTAAETLRQKEVFCDTVLDDDIVFAEDIVGKPAYDVEGHLLGTVKEIMQSPAHDLLVIAGTKELLVPFIDVFVLEITDARVIIDMTNLREG